MLRRRSDAILRNHARLDLRWSGGCVSAAKAFATPTRHIIAPAKIESLDEGASAALQPGTLRFAINARGYSFTPGHGNRFDLVKPTDS